MRAFTLVEIMVSLVILAIGLAAVANSYLVALRAVNSVQNNVVALRLAKEKFANLEFEGLKGVSVKSPAAAEVRSAAVSYRCQEEITVIPESKEFVLASLTVSWSERNSLKNVSLATYLPKQK